jgi:hypothetical protein
MTYLQHQKFLSTLYAVYLDIERGSSLYIEVLHVVCLKIFWRGGNKAGCDGMLQAADTALNKLLKALKGVRPQRVKVIILRKDVDYTLHDVDDVDVDGVAS